MAFDSDNDIRQRFLRACDRVSGFIDLNPCSPTFGSADRSYWHYLDTKGFEVGSYLGCMLGLFGATRTFSDRSDFFGKAASAVMQRWLDNLSCKQGLDEYFPNQRSFCALAHTTLQAAIIGVIQNRNGGVESSSLMGGLTLALRLLVRSDIRPKSANQFFAASLAIDLIAAELAGRVEIPQGCNFAPPLRQ